MTIKGKIRIEGKGKNKGKTGKEREGKGMGREGPIRAGIKGNTKGREEKVKGR